MQTYPSSLYCYFSIESGLRFLETLKFRLLSVCAFNDPFESLFSTNYPHYFLSLTESCTDEEMTVENFHEKELIGSNLEWQLVLRKSLHWAYEKEWRYIKAEKDCKTDEEGAYVSVDKNAIQEIFVGCRIQPDKLETLKSIVSTRFGDIPVKVALPSAYDYTLCFRRLGVSVQK